jgi:AcrR family transcriptional regulator
MTLPAASRRPSAAPNPARTTPRGDRRRAEIVAAAAELFARHGFPSVGMDDIGAAVGVTGPAIYRHFDSKAAVLAAVIDTIIDAVAPPPHGETTPPKGAGIPRDGGAEPGRGETSYPSPLESDPAAALRARIDWYAAGVAARRELMAIFVREVHHLPQEHADRLRQRQRGLVTEWRELLASVHPTWDAERVRTTVHGMFGMFNAVGTFTSPLPDAELAAQLTALAAAALQLPDSRISRHGDGQQAR